LIFLKNKDEKEWKTPEIRMYLKKAHNNLQKDFKNNTILADLIKNNKMAL